MQKKTLSIIIPTLNEEKCLKILLHDITSTLSNETEIIVVDGGSTDETVDLTKIFPVTLVESERGRAKQMNQGAKRACGKFIWFLHADSRIDFDFEHIIKHALANNGWGWFDIQLDTPGFVYRIVEFMMNKRSRLTGIMTGDQGLFIRKDVFWKAGGFPDIALMEDIAISKILKKIDKPYPSDSQLTTSTRRWRKDGIYKTIISMSFFRFVYFIGFSPEWIERKYYKR